MKKKLIFLSIMICSMFVCKTRVFALEDGKDLYNLIKSSALSDTIDFNKRSGTVGEETNGIYITTNTENNVSVYYYRGIVDNNLIFNNMCWKIIRTTEKNGIKLIYNGTPEDGKCNKTGTDTQIGTSKFNPDKLDNAYAGYMYGNVPSTSKEEAQTNTNSSTVKTVIDTWYVNNFTNENITSQIEDTVFYNDRSEVNDSSNHNFSIDENIFNFYGSNYSTYGSVNRSSSETYNLNPSLKYINKNDKFTVSNENGNGKLTYPVGLITLDEAVLAGYNSSQNIDFDYDDTNYLTNGETYWTMSPIGYINVFIFSGLNIGTVCDTQINKLYADDYYGAGVRPVIALSNGVGVKGSGTETNPYVASLYTVKFDVNTISNQYMFDTSSKVVKPTDPSKEGYTFDGWYTESTLTNKYDFDTVVSSSLTLYAKWTKNVVEEEKNNEVVDEIKEETVVENNTNIETNPKTGDFIVRNILFGIISLVVLIVSVIYLKKKKKMN